jgi:RES domain-containing protein
LALPPDLPRVCFSARVYRVTHKDHQPLSCKRSRQRGGRYNPRNEFGVLYATFDLTTAIAEVNKHLNARNSRLSRKEGAWFSHELEVSIEEVLDLTDPGILAKFGVPTLDLVGEDVAATQALAGVYCGTECVPDK